MKETKEKPSARKKDPGKDGADADKSEPFKDWDLPERAAEEDEETFKELGAGMWLVVQPCEWRWPLGLWTRRGERQRGRGHSEEGRRFRVGGSGATGSLSSTSWTIPAEKFDEQFPEMVRGKFR